MPHCGTATGLPPGPPPSRRTSRPNYPSAILEPIQHAAGLQWSSRLQALRPPAVRDALRCRAAWRGPLERPGQPPAGCTIALEPRRAALEN